LELIK